MTVRIKKYKRAIKDEVYHVFAHDRLWLTILSHGKKWAVVSNNNEIVDVLPKLATAKRLCRWLGGYDDATSRLRERGPGVP